MKWKLIFFVVTIGLAFYAGRISNTKKLNVYSFDRLVGIMNDYNKNTKEIFSSECDYSLSFYRDKNATFWYVTLQYIPAAPGGIIDIKIHDTGELEYSQLK